jgi:methylmalonyl-CoA mutase C-terminal domain/subunit
LSSTRVLVAKPGLDGHDRGARLISRVLRDAGMEVIYGGLRCTPQMIAAIAVQEDVEIVGLSILTGGHLGLVNRTIAALAAADCAAIVVVGGVIPHDDIEALHAMGVSAVFPSSTPLQIIVDRMLDIAARTPSPV